MWVKRFLKVGVLILAGVMLIKSGALDLGLLVRLEIGPLRIVAIVSAVAGVSLFNGWRWLIILIDAGVKSHYWLLWRLTCIGYFYNFIMPGGMGGDLAKLAYAAKEHPADRVIASGSVVVDRLAGVLTLLLIAIVGLAFLWVSDWISPPTFMELGRVTGGLLLLGILGLLLTGRLLRWSRLGDLKIRGFQLSTLGRLWPTHWRLVAVASMSIVMHLLALSVMIHAARSMGDTTPALVWLTAGSLAMIFNQVPVSPSGLGVGEFSLFVLLSYFIPEDQPNLGALVFIVFRLAFYLLGLTGGVLLLLDPAAKRVSE